MVDYNTLPRELRLVQGEFAQLTLLELPQELTPQWMIDRWDNWANDEEDPCNYDRAEEYFEYVTDQIMIAAVDDINFVKAFFAYAAEHQIHYVIGAILNSFNHYEGEMEELMGLDDTGVYRPVLKEICDFLPLAYDGDFSRLSFMMECEHSTVGALYLISKLRNDQITPEEMDYFFRAVAPNIIEHEHASVLELLCEDFFKLSDLRLQDFYINLITADAVSYEFRTRLYSHLFRQSPLSTSLQWHIEDILTTSFCTGVEVFEKDQRNQQSRDVVMLYEGLRQASLKGSLDSKVVDLFTGHFSKELSAFLSQGKAALSEGGSFQQGCFVKSPFAEHDRYSVLLCGALALVKIDENLAMEGLLELLPLQGEFSTTYCVQRFLNFEEIAFNALRSFEMDESQSYVHLELIRLLHETLVKLNRGNEGQMSRLYSEILAFYEENGGDHHVLFLQEFEAVFDAFTSIRNRFSTLLEDIASFQELYDKHELVLFD